jgi:hypothetical protein
MIQLGDHSQGTVGAAPQPPLLPPVALDGDGCKLEVLSIQRLLSAQSSSYLLTDQSHSGSCVFVHSILRCWQGRATGDCVASLPRPSQIDARRSCLLTRNIGRRAIAAASSYMLVCRYLWRTALFICASGASKAHEPRSCGSKGHVCDEEIRGTGAVQPQMTRCSSIISERSVGQLLH